MQGYASILLNKIYDAVKSFGIYVITLAVYEDNDVAMKLYCKHGFVKFQEHNDGKLYYVMIKMLF